MWQTTFIDVDGMYNYIMERKVSNNYLIINNYNQCDN